MICVCIGRGRHRHMIAEHRHLVEQGARLIELRLDYINGEVNLKRLLADRSSKSVISCRRQKDGGKWRGSEENRQMLLRTAIAEGIDYVDLEQDVATKISRFGCTKRIVSLHDFDKTPEDLQQVHARLVDADADIVKVCTMANDPHDNLRMLRLVKESPIPTIGICMGEIGIPSRILAGKFGAPFTYSTFHHERALAPGQLSYKEMGDVYHYDRINADTKVYGVIADPIGHSLSPIIHNAAFHHMGTNKVYVPFRVPRGNLEEFVGDAIELGICGLSVTIPHKEAILRFLDKIDGAVRGIGAANTVVFQDGKTLGYNTDFRAAMTCLDRMTETRSNDVPLKGKTALVLGAGGVAKALVFGLKRRGANVVIAGRTLERAEALAKYFDCRAIDWSLRHSVKATVVVNGTPVGMHPNVDVTPFDKQHLRPPMVVFDTVYNPETTLLVKEARQQLCKVVTGVEMFVRQAAQQYQLFTGDKAPMELMRDELKRATGAVKW